MHWIYQNSSGWEQAWNGIGIDPLFFVGIIPLLIAWSLAWKGWALYLAARRGEIVWFIVFLLINTVGLLEIFYIFAVAKRSDVKIEDLPKKHEPKEGQTQ